MEINKTRKKLIKKLLKLDPSASEAELVSVSLQMLRNEIALKKSWAETKKRMGWS